MHEVGVDVHGVEIGATPHRTESRTQRPWTGEISRVEFEPCDLEITVLKPLVAKAPDLDRHRFCQLLRQIANMNARTAINVWRILVSQEQDLHPCLGRYSDTCVKRRIGGTGVCHECRGLISRAAAAQGYRPHDAPCRQSP